MLPPNLSVETAAARLLDTLEGKAKTRLLARAAESEGLALVRREARGPKGAVQVERILKEVGDVASTLRDWSDKLERQGLALVVRSSDPGVEDTARCCPGCKTPQLLLAAREAAEGKGNGWSLTFLEERGGEE